MSGKIEISRELAERLLNFTCNEEYDELRALLAAPVVERQPVAYLDIGAGGYMDLGSDLSDEELSRLPYGRHVLAIAGTYGIDGYTSPPAPTSINSRS